MDETARGLDLTLVEVQEKVTVDHVSDDKVEDSQAKDKGNVNADQNTRK